MNILLVDDKEQQSITQKSCISPLFVAAMHILAVICQPVI
jgi:hypothetical protein